MTPGVRKTTISSGAATSAIPREEWSGFLEAFDQQHHGWLTQLEIYDRKTLERVVHHHASLQAIELDLEDERHPRINVSVQLGNKVTKHILYQPSHMVLHTSNRGSEESLQVETVNTETTIRFRSREGYAKPAPE